MRTAKRSNYIFLSLSLFALSTLSSEAYAAAQAAGQIILVKGEVFILSAKDKSVVADPSGKRGRSTQKGSSFFEGETIQTKEGARVKLSFVEGGNEVVLGSSTSLVVERAGGAKPGTELTLKQGAARASVNRKYSGEGGDIFEVKTPNSVAGVRGTVFNVNYDAKRNSTQVFTERGSVAVSKLGASAPPTLVTAGMFSEVQKSAAPTQPQAAPQKMIDSVVPQDDSSVEKGSSPAAGTESKKDEGPSVALAPQPADSSSKATETGRAPASSESKSAPKTIGNSVVASAAPSIATQPFDMVAKQAESMRRSAEEQLRQQRLVEGNLTEIRVPIK